jgi:hypothetical protein
MKALLLIVIMLAMLFAACSGPGENRPGDVTVDPESQTVSGIGTGTGTGTGAGGTTGTGTGGTATGTGVGQVRSNPSQQERSNSMYP